MPPKYPQVFIDEEDTKSKIALNKEDEKRLEMSRMLEDMLEYVNRSYGYVQSYNEKYGTLQYPCDELKKASQIGRELSHKILF